MDRRMFIKGAAAAVGGYTLLGATGCEPGPIAGQGYRLVWEDNFDALDRNVWVPTPAHRLNQPADAATVADSVLTLKADQADPLRPYQELCTLGPYQQGLPHYPQAKAWQCGYFEVRARCTKSPWSKLALWFFGMEMADYYDATRPCSKLNAEWDMVENGIRSGRQQGAFADVDHVTVVHSNTNNSCGVQDVSTFRNKAGTNLCDWHTWGGLWTPAEVKTYLDGQLMTTQPTPASFAQPLFFIISAAPLPFTPLGPMPPKPAFIETQVDYFRVWQK